MKNKVFMALLLAGALVLGPISGSLASFNVSAESGSASVSDDASPGNGEQGGGETNPDVSPGNGEQGGDTEQTVDKLVEDAKEGMDESNADSKVEAVLEAIGSTEVIKEVLAADAAAIEDLEEAYLSAKGLQATQLESDGKLASVVGAGLNELEDGATGAVLVVEAFQGVPSEEPDVNYRGGMYTLLDINLEGVKNPENLRCPVKITMNYSGFPYTLNPDKETAVLHYVNGTKEAPEKLIAQKNGDGTFSFCVSSFSSFVFIDADLLIEESDDNKTENNKPADSNKPGTSKPGNSSSDDDDDSSAGGSDFAVDVENQIMSAASGATVKISGITALSNGMMKALLEKKDVTLVMEYTYEGKNYTVVIPAGAAVNDDIPWYGPLYLAGRYGNSGSYAGSGSAYVVKSGDTMSKIAKVNRMTLAQLAAKNPQVKNIDLIRVGQKINL